MKASSSAKRKSNQYLLIKRAVEANQMTPEKANEILL
jgi:hypothetical protein